MEVRGPWDSAGSGATEEVQLLPDSKCPWITLSLVHPFHSTVVPEILLKVQHHENKLEHSQFTSADGVNEDLALNDQMIDILSSEDPGSMLQALEE